MRRISLKQSIKYFFMPLVLGIAMSGLSSVARADAASSAKVKTAMSAMKTDSEKLGAPKVEGDALFYGTTKMNGNFELVDSLKSRFGGTATFFVKKGNDFVRVTTNVMKDGARAIGTKLDPSGPAMAAIRQGNDYYGIVDILGKLYDTGYAPIKTSKGETIGIYYFGYLLE